MPIATECGCIVNVTYDWLDITKNLVEAYGMSRDPQNNRVYQAFDDAFRELQSTNMQPFFYRFEIQDAGGGNPVTQYNIPDLIDSMILGVSVEGVGIDESNPAIFNVNTSTGDVTMSNIAPGQYIKIDYKKAV